jgi:hypothetical protein
MSKQQLGTNQTISMYVTSYGFNDNDPPSADIAYSKSEGNPTLHDVATEGSGTYDDPITFATSKDELEVGARVYVPHLRKYFIMEDDCAECDQDWQNGQRYHIDLWMGPSHSSPDSLLDCEDKITRASAPVIVNPDPGLPVETTPLFSNGQCTARLYNGDDGDGR